MTAEILRLLQASSCFRGEVCASLPCACAETLAALTRHAQRVLGEEVYRGLQEAMVLIGAKNDNVSEAVKASNINAAWHILDRITSAVTSTECWVSGEREALAGKLSNALREKSYWTYDDRAFLSLVLIELVRPAPSAAALTSTDRCKG